MVNPILGTLNQNRLMGQMAPIKNMLKSVRNPQAMLQQMMSNNPQYKQVMQFVQDNGGDAEKAFYSLANQMGVDPEQILSMLK